jgi:putative hydrolase of the HAD superfamily
MIKNIVFDMGNVLARFDAARFCASRVSNAEDCALVYREVFTSVEWARIDRGVISNADAVASMCTRLPARLHADADFLVNHWYDHFEPDPDMASFIARLKVQGSKIYLLSTAGRDFYAFAPKLTALSFFDGTLVSCDVHFLKPDHRIFDALCKKFSLKAEECFFVDDMFSNVEGALFCGFSGFVYRGSVPELEQALRGVLGGSR